MPVENTKIEYFIMKIRDEYPEFLTTSDLIKLNLVTSRFSACHAKKKGAMPPFIRMGRRKILFPRESLLEWLLVKFSAQNKQEIEDEFKA